jgi:hypothetical protein
MDRWFFYDPLKHETFVLDNPAAHPGFQRWKVTRVNPLTCRVLSKEPIVLFGDIRLQGKKLRATQRDSVKCTTACKRATKPVCICSCGGKNHGIENRGLAETGEMPEVVYVGDH